MEPTDPAAVTPHSAHGLAAAAESQGGGASGYCELEALENTRVGQDRRCGAYSTYPRVLHAFSPRPRRLCRSATLSACSCATRSSSCS
ncbi:uncharacterized protein METZ01_LOCUS480296 [marine metagenome]|uniref:Uncharacterized protein n=1 Tax=marine metagenome TaxID=408172 RepID=A0A383C5G6_9ZZZZ